MPPIEEITKITRKGQTTVPKAVRQALGVDYGGKIAFCLDEGGVTVRRVDEDDDGNDPALAGFLKLLSEDMRARPDAVADIPSDLALRIFELTKGITVDPDDAVEGDVIL
jgi:antitoxin PrlF